MEQFVQIKDFTAKHLVMALHAAGYEASIREFTDSQILYIGKNLDGVHTFAVSFEDKDTQMYMVTTLYIKINSDTGLIIGDWASMPYEDDLTYDEMETFFRALELQQKYKL